jgi:multidrug efflux system membrane fusion protein
MRRIVVWLLVLGVLGGGAYVWLLYNPAQMASVQDMAGNVLPRIGIAYTPPAATMAPATGRAARLGPDLIPVVVAPAGSRDVPIYLDGLGTAQASANVTVKPQVDGALLEVRFTEGQNVNAGDVLAKIDPRLYQATLDQVSAKKAQDEATLANARVDAARYAKLAATAYTSAQQADTSRALVAQLTAQVAADQAQIDNARTQLGYTTIVAPISGRAGIRLVDAGNIVHASDPTGLVVLATLKPISVLFTLPQQALPAIAAAIQAGPVTVLALPQNNAPTTERTVLDRGTLTVLDNQVDPATGTIKLKASFPNDDLKLWPGAFVTVRLQARVWQNATVVPPVALQRGPRGTFVYVVTDAGVALRRPVTVGHEELALAVIAEGLKPGERVVIDGAARLSDGSKVVAVAPAGTQRPAASPPASP